MIEKNVNPLHTRPGLSLTTKALRQGSDNPIIESDDILSCGEERWELRRRAYRSIRIWILVFVCTPQLRNGIPVRE